MLLPRVVVGIDVGHVEGLWEMRWYAVGETGGEVVAILVGYGKSRVRIQMEGVADQIFPAGMLWHISAMYQKMGRHQVLGILVAVFPLEARASAVVSLVVPMLLQIFVARRRALRCKAGTHVTVPGFGHLRILPLILIKMAIRRPH